MLTRNWAFFVFLICFITNCANPGVLTGGPKDERPPHLDTLNSTPNLQTNFRLQTIELTFDEWIKLNNVFEQVVISPPITPTPEITLRKKTVNIEFDEAVELRENATYTINFGEAVQDLTESNPAEDLRFVFSTGDFIDSLEVSGTVKDALTEEVVENVLVMLYDNLSDTIVRTELPFYFSRTDKEGNFTIRNVRADTFKVFALEEQLSNYLFDFDNERIGFPDSFLVVTDSSVNRLELEIFQEDPDLEIKNIDQSKYGLATIAFNQKPLNLMFRYEANFEELFFDYEKDSLRIWYDLTTRDSSVTNFIFSKDSVLTDTIDFTAAHRAEFITTGNLKLQKAQKSINQNPLRPLQLRFNHPLATFDSTLLQLYEDTLKTPVFSQVNIDSTAAHRKLFIQYKWKENIAYELEILPEALTDIYGISNPDSIVLSLNIQSLEDFGSINLTIDSLDNSKQYLVEVGLENALPIGEFVVSDTTTWQQNFLGVKTGTYQVKIMIDANKNGRWDSGNYDLKTKPEKIITKSLEELRPNWDLEATVKVIEDF